ncbi:MAG: ABC transporter ATP-binding protein [Armatimonadota bacterium]|nr:MAG: ABC transporter ATP-binding protein [Armatimonadota bacterium]
MGSLRRLLPILRPHTRTVAIGTLLMIGVAGTGLLPPLLIKRTIDDVLLAHKPALLLPMAIAFVLVFGVHALFVARRTYVMHVLGQRFVLDIRRRLYDHLQRLSLTYYDARQTGEIMSRVSNDVNVLEDLVVHGTDTVIVQILTLVGAAAIVFGYLSWELGLVILAPVPILLVSIYRFSLRIRPIYRSIRDRLGDINARLQDNLSGIRVIKAFTREGFEQERFDRESTEYYDMNVRGIRLWSSFFPKIEYLVSLGMVGVITVGGWLFIQDRFPFGTVAAALLYVDMFYRPVGELFRVYDVILRASAGADRIFEIFDAQTEVRDAPDAVAFEDLRGEVAFDDVYFRYATGEQVLQGINLHVNPGERIALVGRSGAGKTSIINLLPRFYDPESGAIRIDGRDIRTAALDSLRSRIAMVLQETFLFSGTVRENLAYGNLNATDHEIEEAAKVANAHEFIMELPDGYETQVGERGIKLSGGQKQRIAIARAVLADPRILILDEATSSVDAESEYLIHQALERLMRGRTTFIVAHRLSTIKNADRIVVLEDGRVVAQADHQTLLATSPVYAQLYDMQFRVEAASEAEQRSAPADGADGRPPWAGF